MQSEREDEIWNSKTFFCSNLITINKARASKTSNPIQEWSAMNWRTIWSLCRDFTGNIKEWEKSEEMSWFGSLFELIWCCWCVWCRLSSLFDRFKSFVSLLCFHGAERVVLLIYLILARSIAQQLKMNANSFFPLSFFSTSCSIVYQMTITNVTHSSAIWQTADAPHFVSDNLISPSLTGAAVICLTASRWRLWIEPSFFFISVLLLHIAILVNSWHCLLRSSTKIHTI